MYQFKLHYMAYRPMRIFGLRNVSLHANKPILDFGKPITINSPMLPVEALGIIIGMYILNTD